MSTRAQIRFATREDGVSFSEHPEKIHANVLAMKFYVGELCNRIKQNDYKSC